MKNPVMFIYTSKNVGNFNLSLNFVVDGVLLFLKAKYLEVKNIYFAHQICNEISLNRCLNMIQFKFRARGTNHIAISFIVCVLIHLSQAYSLFCSTSEGLRQYNLADTICCNGTLHRRFSNGKEWECCPDREQLFNKATQICCGMQIVDQYNSEGDERVCQFENISIKRTQLNCYGEVRDKLSDSYGCCGYEIYDSREKGCCQIHNETSGTPKYKIYNSPINISNGERCCGDVKYSQNGDKVCFGNELWSKYIKLCGGKTYNISENVCCDNKSLKPLPRDSSSQRPLYRCHNGKVYDQSIEYFIPGDPDRHIVDQIIPIGHRPCGNTSYNESSPRQYLCCADHLWNVSLGERVACCGKTLIRYEEGEKCCSGQMFNETNKVCCNGTLMDRFETDVKCCGSKLPYNAKTDVCCLPSTLNTYKVVRKKKVDDTSCCNGNPYNKFKEEEVKKACGGKRELKPSCDTTQQARRACIENKRNEFRVRINSITSVEKKFKIKATILKPRKYRSQDVFISTEPGPCRSFKENKVYRLFTNRKYKKNKTLRITDNDIVMQKTKRFNKLYRDICPFIKLVKKKFPS